MTPGTLDSEAKPQRAVVAGSGDLEATFRCPPASHGPVPFYWWAGEKLQRDRIAWQLDRLRENGVRQTVVSYPHHPDGSSNLGDPELFSRQWWDLFRWFLAACRERGMTAGFQDYTLVEPILKAIGRETPGMQGGQMSCVSRQVSGTLPVRLGAEPGSIVIGAWAYPMPDGQPAIQRAIPLADAVSNGLLEWIAPEGDWFVALVFARLNEFDPLHPEAGALAVARLYEPFERECPGELGRSLNLFFQDELDFGSRMPFWSNQLFDAFAARHDYDLYPMLPMLWHDLGSMTEKVRLDFADTVAARAEECYFKPVCQWHADRGILFGNDNCGRGRIAEGRAHYGDYFRAMRWYSAPGCDDPRLDGPRAFKGLKVNSSIAHLYRRPRVWVEAFHSSGWGVTPADIVAAINEDFAYGATVVNLHGLYYSTRGGWWEWAPPDFHFRQPYWMHGRALNEYFTRVCWLLSQGVHRCDVAIVYPIASIDAEPADPAPATVVAHIGNESIGAGKNDYDDPVESAFGLGKHLFDHACDFDFIDFDSLARAEAGEGMLVVTDACYRVLVFPAMKAVRIAMIRKALDFVHAGGTVIAYGRLPAASDNMGRNDPVLDGLLEQIFGSSEDDVNLVKHHPGGGNACFFRNDYVAVLAAIDSVIERDVRSNVPMQVLHRQIDDRDAYFVFNASGAEVTADLRFRDVGKIDHWDAWTGNILPVATHPNVTVTLAPREARLLVRTRDPVAPHAASLATVPTAAHWQDLDGPWKAVIHPVMDNRFGDFSLPATRGVIGPQARRFRYCDEHVEEPGWQAAGFDDSAWPETTFSFGAQLEYAGPFPPESDFSRLDQSLADGRELLDWRPYVFSRRWGIENDPFLTDWLSGPHGLKGVVPDEFLDFHSDVVGSVWYLRAKVMVSEPGDHRLVTGARCGYQVWLNGRPAAGQPDAQPPGYHAPWKIPHYECRMMETVVALGAGANDLLVKLVQPAGQRTRAFVAFDPPPPDPDVLGLRWFAGDSSPRPYIPATPGRRAIRFRFTSPPGLREISFTARGRARVWVGGVEFPASHTGDSSGGCRRYRVVVATDPADLQCVAIRVEAPEDSHAGDALPEPVAFTCGVGVILAGDWCAHGLATYSGAVEYRRIVELPEIPPGGSVLLDLGKVLATAEIRVNGSTAAVLVTPPWRCDLTPFLTPGGNMLSITVANTLANHYGVGIPTPYAFASQTPSGLIGPVSLCITP